MDTARRALAKVGELEAAHARTLARVEHLELRRDPETYDEEVIEEVDDHTSRLNKLEENLGRQSKRLKKLETDGGHGEKLEELEKNVQEKQVEASRVAAELRANLTTLQFDVTHFHDRINYFVDKIDGQDALFRVLQNQIDALKPEDELLEYYDDQPKHRFNVVTSPILEEEGWSYFHLSKPYAAYTMQVDPIYAGESVGQKVFAQVDEIIGFKLRHNSIPEVEYNEKDNTLSLIWPMKKRVTNVLTGRFATYYVCDEEVKRIEIINAQACIRKD